MRLPLALCLVSVCLSGCFKPSDCVPGEPGCEGGPIYSLDLSHPDSLLQDIEESWRRREINEYIKLMAPEFVFVFQQDDAFGIPEGFWNRDDDSTGVANIFDSPEVTAIRTDLTWGQPESGQLTTTEEEATRSIVFDTFLDVDLNGGETTLRVDGDVQWFFFRRGDEAKNEPTDRWYIIEWQDLGSTTKPRTQPHPLASEAPPGSRIEYVTMGQLITRLSALRN